MRQLPSRLVLVLLLASSLAPADVHARPVAGSRGMVATAHPLASAAGVEILRGGGNAADAAAAAAFALAVVEPYSSGIGGGGFALARIGDVLTFLDFREVAPRRARASMFVKDGAVNTVAARDGILSAAVPGAVAGYLELQRRFGKLTRAAVLGPAIRLATMGFEVTPRYRRAATGRLDLLRADPEATRIFLVPGAAGEPAEVPPLGHTISQPDLARTLEAIGERGAGVFYEGAVARALAADMKTRGGLITLDDLKRFRVRERAPLVGSFRGHAIASSPPPSSGGTILLTILNVMETLPVETPWRAPQRLHLYVEASKRAFADRILLGDPDYVDYVTELVPHLVAKDRAVLLARTIGEKAARAPEVLPGQGAHLSSDVPRLPAASASGGPDTSHLCVVDGQGNAVSMTTTVNYGWGSGVVARATGVLWNDEMDDFAVAPGVPNAYEIVGSSANQIAPGKVPLSSMSPTILFAGATVTSPVWLVVGSPGGSRIPTTVAQTIMSFVDHGADVQDAITMGRVHHQHLPDIIRAERFALEPATIAALETKGHAIEIQEAWSNATGIAIDPSTAIRTGAADPRGIGVALAE